MSGALIVENIMSTSKGLRSKKGANLPRFIQESQKTGKQAQISVRIPLALHRSFEQARQTLREHGRDMQMADLVRSAIQDACEAVADHYGTAGESVAPKSDVGCLASKNDGEHSSRGCGEEWGAKGDGDDQSPSTEAPPLTGSGPLEKAEPGVELPRAGGRDGAR
jgi:hypothetical protein